MSDLIQRDPSRRPTVRSNGPEQVAVFDRVLSYEEVYHLTAYMRKPKRRLFRRAWSPSSIRGCALLQPDGAIKDRQGGIARWVDRAPRWYWFRVRYWHLRAWLGWL